MSEQLQQRFGLLVRQIRKRQGHSQQALADAAGLNRSYLGEIERGVVCPSLQISARLAAALALPLSQLLRDCEEP